ncbi:hypothetical protein SAMN05421874_104340 [Nonomuraea maritima]|uniref:Uncharacterized protein n=1 Tax=Nonomuraea maritima TaxID=683260 RepID=A0A1G8YDA4_9ACTN|nr:hypothetical protein [Nonomuraea maritima]SDK00020.1 hypothetical protein SAMN05421874_104340 [Nonomuraea maritima]
MRFRTGLLTTGLAIGVVVGVSGTTAASASAASLAGGAPAVAAAWADKPGCTAKLDKRFSIFAKKMGVSERRLKEALVDFEQDVRLGEISPAEVRRLARRLGVSPAETGANLKKVFGSNAKPCRHLPPADPAEGKRFAEKLGVTLVEAERVLDWATKPDGRITDINPHDPKCVGWARKLHVSPKRLAAELEDVKLLREATR